MKFEMAHWKEIKEKFPHVAAAILAEYNLRNGFVPYEHGYVYVIQACGTNYFKIGKTTNPDKCILQIAPQMPFPTRYIRVWPSNFMSMAEKLLHCQFQELRTNGEWFDLQDDMWLALLLDFSSIPNSVKYTYGNFFFDLIGQSLKSQQEGWWFRENFDVDPGRVHGLAIARIERLFDQIGQESFPAFPEEVQSRLSHYKTNVLDHDALGAEERS